MKVVGLESSRKVVNRMFQGTKDELRIALSRQEERAKLMSLAATALMNGLVTWDRDIGYCDFYQIRIIRATITGNFKIVTKVEKF